jgi:hypothetical protein
MLQPNALEADSDFFQWGGHSLSAAALAGSLRRIFATKVIIILIIIINMLMPAPMIVLHV